MDLVLDKIFVDNLKCSGCGNSIRNGLMKIVGVTEVRSNPNEGWVEIEHENLLDKTVITKKLAELGYPEAGTTNLLQTAKSYVSCAIGRIS